MSAAWLELAWHIVSAQLTIDVKCGEGMERGEDVQQQKTAKK